MDAAKRAEELRAAVERVKRMMSGEGMDQAYRAHPSPHMQHMKDRILLSDECVRLLDAADARGREGWQPIETAPKDGTYILGYFPDACDYLPQCGITAIKWIGSYAGWGTRGVCGLSPTHWQPLPTPPAPGGATGTEGTK